MLRKSVDWHTKNVDVSPYGEHSEKGSKRFEEQQAGGNEADLERASAAPTLTRRGGGEREEIGRIRQVDRQAAKAVERFDPEGGKNPGGEWRSPARQAEPGSGSATGQRQ